MRWSYQSTTSSFGSTRRSQSSARVACRLSGSVLLERLVGTTAAQRGRGQPQQRARVPLDVVGALQIRRGTRVVAVVEATHTQQVVILAVLTKQEHLWLEKIDRLGVPPSAKEAACSGERVRFAGHDSFAAPAATGRAAREGKCFCVDRRRALQTLLETPNLCGQPHDLPSITETGVFDAVLIRPDRLDVRLLAAFEVVDRTQILFVAPLQELQEFPLPRGKLDQGDPIARGLDTKAGSVVSQHGLEQLLGFVHTPQTEQRLAGPIHRVGDKGRLRVRGDKGVQRGDRGFEIALQVQQAPTLIGRLGGESVPRKGREVVLQAPFGLIEAVRADRGLCKPEMGRCFLIGAGIRRQGCAESSHRAGKIACAQQRDTLVDRLLLGSQRCRDRQNPCDCA